MNTLLRAWIMQPAIGAGRTHHGSRDRSATWLAFCLLGTVPFGISGCSHSEALTTALSTGNSRSDIESAGYTFATPIRLTADGEPIRVQAPGYACPTVADVDSDGIDDLVVGQFNGGQMKFYKNIAEKNETPQLATGEWLKTEDEPLSVPGVW